MIRILTLDLIFFEGLRLLRIHRRNIPDHHIKVWEFFQKIDFDFKNCIFLAFSGFSERESYSYISQIWELPAFSAQLWGTGWWKHNQTFYIRSSQLRSNYHSIYNFPKQVKTNFLPKSQFVVKFFLIGWVALSSH